MAVDVVAVVACVREALQRAVDALPPGAAVVYEDELPDADGVRFEFVPARTEPGCAELTLEVPADGDHVPAVFGTASTVDFAVDPGAPWGEPLLTPYEDGITALALAVAHGAGSERLWLRGERVVRSEGNASIGDQVLVVRSPKSLLAGVGTRCELREFAPYPGV